MVGQAQGNDTGVLASDHLAVTFSPETGGIVSVRSLRSNHEFVRPAAKKPLLWRLVLRGRDRTEMVLDNTRVGPPEFESKIGSLALHWQGVELPGSAGTLTVRVTCELAREDDTARLRLWVQNDSSAFGLWDVQFPVIAPLVRSEESQIAMGRGSWGVLYANSGTRITGVYPSHSLPMQFALLQQGKNGLYLATHDPKALFKEFTFEPSCEFYVNTHAMDMGVTGSDWEAPYPFALGVYQGDWMTGCKRYRHWALEAAPWTRKGPLGKREDVPESLKNVCAWVIGNGATAEVVPAVELFAEAIGAPVGVHWYNWHKIPFDWEYPNYFPPKPGFAEGVLELKQRGIVVMPYINARLWDIATANFAEAKAHCVKDDQQEVTIERYGKSADLAPMCPTQPFWQNKVAEIIRRLGDECGVNAVYLDQIASAPPRLCFDANHGHPLGSGSWWVDGYRQMLDPIKKWATSDGRQMGLTTENNAEPYMDNLDGFLIWTPRSDQEIPMNSAVYSGYTLYFASNRAFEHGDVSYCLCQARDFVWGTQLGWDGTAIVEPQHKAKLAFLGRLARLRAAARDYLVCGELLEVLEPTNEVPNLSGTWNTPDGDGPVTLKAVHGALWRGLDGSAGVLLANADTDAHVFSFTIDTKRHGLGSSAEWVLRQVGAENQTRISSQDNGQVSHMVDVPGRDGLCLVLQAASSD
ncbi:MAG: hypothetical protein A2W31_00165 [Planctomycetes bacterium RBG_16_64_10]|nr:MAG: hypothetical protein A2W31_00165 [Planctomycetes bacterium RBG_16_64_10]